MSAQQREWGLAGVAGAIGIACYIAFIAIPWPDGQLGATTALLTAAAWPLLSIVYSYGLFSYVAAAGNRRANVLALLFSLAAFTTVLTMLIVQLAVDSGLPEITRNVDSETASLLRRSLRLIDLGVDVAWDLLIGTALIFSGVAISSSRGFGRRWGYPSVILGAALIALNALTFPWPPASRGLFDVGPLVGLFVMAMSVRLAVLGFREPPAA